MGTRATEPAQAPLWTIDDLADYLGVPKKTVLQWRWRDKAGRNKGRPSECPPAIKVGGHVRFRPEDVLAWVESRREAA